MKIITLPVGQLQTNCYLAIDEKTKEAIIIDPGDDADFIIRRLQDENATPLQILATHGHFDHVLAATELMLAFTIPFCLHKNDIKIILRMQSTAKYFLKIEIDPPPPVNLFLKENDSIAFGKEHLTVLETPGHTPGSISLYDGKGILFTGDTIFAYGDVGRTDLEGGNRQQLELSITHKLFTLPKKTIIYPGHGETSTIGAERRIHVQYH